MDRILAVHARISIRRPNSAVARAAALVLWIAPAVTSTAGAGETADQADEARHPAAPPATAITNAIGMELVRVPAGSFAMGASAGEPGRQFNETPQHVVRISRPFYLAKHETTTAQFRAFVDATGYVTEAERDPSGGFGIDFATATVRQHTTATWRQPGFPGETVADEHPVVLVSWSDAEAFCRWLSGLDGRSHRLPTEAEWELAARGGTTSAWWCGDDPAALRGVANLADASLRRAVPAATWAEPWDDGYAFLAPVGRFAANPLGLHDMHGNAWEWCADYYHPEAYRHAGPVDPAGASFGRLRSIRGGGWFNTALRNRSAQRVYFDPRFRYCLLSGFRVLVEVPERAPVSKASAAAVPPSAAGVH
ncbi:MAG: formylglycine-generating enzyme family protein [Planctomycetota bacterium]|jgi:formylglycine-generating enzyme required for sulfatase activity